MVFSSMTFIFAFLPLVLTLYFSIKNIKLKNLVLCVFSLIFYAWGEPIYILLMLATIVFNYIFAILMDKSKSHRKMYFVLIVVVDLLILFFFKYANFLIENINTIFKLKINSLNFTLPIGISFYTFQILSYIIDVYREDTRVQRSLINFATYVSLFPQLVAGPIVRYQTIADELKNRKTTIENFYKGIRRFAKGFAKKVMIANSVAIIADGIYSDVYGAGTILLWIAAICYSLQIYFDFSGYSDMAIGLGKIFGFNFLENFNRPYIATSITDFWRRWHISLSSWFRDYVYIPLGGNKTNKIKWFRNILIVWILTGLWHGASWNFILWGLFYGLILITEKIFLLSKIKKMPKFFSHLYSIIIIIIGWTIFRVENINELFYALKRMFLYRQNNIINYFLENSALLKASPFVFIGILLCIPILSKKINNYKNRKFVVVLVDILIYIAFVLSVLKLIGDTYNPFIYFRF